MYIVYACNDNTVNIKVSGNAKMDGFTKADFVEKYSGNIILIKIVTTAKLEASFPLITSMVDFSAKYRI